MKRQRPSRPRYRSALTEGYAYVKIRSFPVRSNGIKVPR